MIRTPDHIVIVILENHSYSEIVGNSNAPYINSLIADSKSATFSNSFGVTHPSQPNYLDLYSGSNQGVTDDSVPSGTTSSSGAFFTTNLGRQLIDAGGSFITYSEDLPSVGYEGASSGNYARKHNPVANFQGTGTNQVPSTCNQPFTSFPSDYTTLPTVSYVVPNQNNDMHDGTIAQGDAWVQTHLNAYVQWAKENNSLFILTFDEDDSSEANKILTIITGEVVAGGTYSSPTINHYSILKMIEDFYGLAYATSNVTSATSIVNSGIWNITAANTTPDIFLSQIEMSPNGGQAYDEFYWLNSNNASLSYSTSNFPVTGSYRFDLSAYAVKGTPIIGVYLDNVLQGSVTITSTSIGIFSLFINSITAGVHVIKIQLSNFNSAANHGRVGLLYFTNTTSTTPYVYPTITPIPLVWGDILQKEHYGSHHLRGFNLGSNGTNASGSPITDMQAMVNTGANIARCFVEIYRPNSPCEGGSSTADVYDFKPGELTKLATTVSRAQSLHYYVVPVLFLDPCYNTDYWGNPARQASIISLWQQLATIYNGNAAIGGYDLINEPRQNDNYKEVIQFQANIIEAIRLIDTQHVVMIECISNDMFAMMLPLNYENVVYSPHGYSTLLITHQGVAGESEANVINKYPTLTSTSNLSAVWNINNLSQQHDDVRIMTHRFNVPVFIGEFSCINWSPQNDAGGWTSTEWCNDNIILLEAEGWSWVYHAWRGDYAGWESEIPSSYYTQFTFSNAAPQGLPSYSNWIKARSNNAPTIVMLKGWFGLNAQQTLGYKFGIWGMGETVPNSSAFTAFLPALKGFYFRTKWKDYENIANNYVNSYLTGAWVIAMGYNLYVGEEMFVAPTSGDNTPDYVFQPPYNVPLVVTDATSNNQFPYYLYNSPSYPFKTRFLAMHEALNGLVAQVFTFYQSEFILIQSAEGSTGDESPYKGNPINVNYDIIDADWDDYKHSVWSTFYSAINSEIPFSSLIINQGNDNSNYQWSLDNIANAWFKAGEFTHVYNFPNEKNYALLLIALKTSSTNNNRVRGELEQTVDSTWWLQSTTQNLMALVGSCLHAGIDILTIGTANSLTDHTAYDFFNKYAGIRNANESNIGFCMLRDIIDLADLNRFPEGTYQTLVASQDQASYNSKFNNIVNSGQPAAQIQYRLTQLLCGGNNGNPYLNASRITAIRNAFPTAVYDNISNSLSTSVQSYIQDFGVNMIPDNYYRFITQYNPNVTSVGVWRSAAATDFWGRFGRRTDFATSKNEMFFAVDSGLTINSNYIVKIKVTYLNNGGGTWSLNYFNGNSKVSAGSITNGSSTSSAQHEFTINDFQGGGNLSNATDFTLKRLSGADSTFYAVEITVVSQNTQGIAGSYILGNTLSTICNGTPTTLYTDGAFTSSSVLYSDSLLQTPQTGFAYVVRISTNHIYNLNSSTGQVTSDTGTVCGSGTAGNYITGSVLTSVCSGTPATLYTNGAFGVGVTLYTDINLTIPKTGASYVVTTSDNHIYNLNSSTGVVGSDTGNICNSGTSGSYILGNTLSTVCSGNATTLYTSGSFSVGKTLYQDVNLLIPKTGFTYVVRTSTNHVYNLNTSTGVIGSDTGTICGSGTSGNYILGNTLNTVCDGNATVLYTSGSFATGKVLYQDINLTTPETGFIYVVNVSDSHIYNVNTSTGAVVSDSGYICNSGVPVTIILGNTLGTVCAGSQSTAYVNGSFAVSGILYTTNDLITPITGFTFVVYNNEIYNLNTSTGQITSDTGSNCTGGTAGTYKVGTVLNTVCSQGNNTYYTNGAFTIGGTLYTDVSLTTPVTGSTYVVDTSTNNIYNLNTSTGVIGSQVGICNGGTSLSVKLGSDTTTVCSQSNTTVYTIGAFMVGKTLYSDINVTTIVTGSTYFENNVTGHVYNLNTSTGVVGSDTGIICGSGTSGTYKLGNDVTTICSAGNTTLYTNGAFTVGGTLYTDINLTTAQTGNVYVVNTANNHVYNLDTGTGVIGSDSGVVCGSGISGSYKVGSDITTVCGSGNVTLYSSDSFSIGDVLYNDINLTIPHTGDIYVVQNDTGRVFNIDTSTGVVGADTSTICGSGTNESYKLGNDQTTICSQGNTTLYTRGTFIIGDVLYQDINLTIPQTGYNYVVRVSTNTVYNLNTSTGVVGSATGIICGSGKTNPGKKKGDFSGICSIGSEDFFIDGTFDIGKIIYTDVDLTTPLTGYSYFQLDSNKVIYQIDSVTGEVLSQTSGICGGGTPAQYKVDVSLEQSICGNDSSTYYTLGLFAIGSILYTDIDMLIPLTGYNYIVTTDGNVYNIDSSTGEVTSFTGDNCLRGAVGIYKVGNDLNTICSESNIFLYLFTTTGLKSGDVIYDDVNLTIPKTGYDYVVDVVSGDVFLLGNTTGLVGDRLDLNCNVSSGGVKPPPEKTVNFVNYQSQTEYKKYIQMVVTDARASEIRPHASSWDIQEKTDMLSAFVSDTCLFYLISTIDSATIAGFFLFEPINVRVIKRIFRPAFESQKNSLHKQIQEFIQSGAYINDILTNLRSQQ